MSTAGQWEGGQPPRRRFAAYAAMIAGAVVVGLLVGRGGAEPTPPSELVVEETERAPDDEPVPSNPPDPMVAGAWRTVSPSPLRGRSLTSAAWTGSRLMIWGGAGTRVYADGALYNPRLDRWEPVPHGPLTPRVGHASVWDGDEVVIAGGEGRVRRFEEPVDLRSAAAYDPAIGRWRRLPDLPFAVSDGRVFAAAGRLYAVARTAGRRPVAVLDAGSAMWRLLPPAPPFGGDETAAGVIGDTLLIWPASPDNALALDLRSQQWTRLDIGPRRGDTPGPVRDLDQCGCTVVSGRYPAGGADLMAYDADGRRWWRHYVEPIRPSFAAGDDELLYLVQTPYSAAALDRSTGAVLRVPPPPQEPAIQPVMGWTGDALFLWSGVNPLKFRYPSDGLLFIPTR